MGIFACSLCAKPKCIAIGGYSCSCLKTVSWFSYSFMVLLNANAIGTRARQSRHHPLGSSQKNCGAIHVYKPSREMLVLSLK